MTGPITQKCADYPRNLAISATIRTFATTEGATGKKKQGIPSSS
jgi:hypothetical protein